MRFSLTIIIPFFNGKSFIRTNFDCCLKISKKYNVEIIYIDNCSKDESFSIIKKRIENKKNFLLFSTKKKDRYSPGIARNIGIKKARSNYVLFLDIDDVIKIKFFGKLIKFLKKTKLNIIYLKKISNKQKLSPYIKYDKTSLKKFFTQSNNMEVIGLIFNKNFLNYHKILFKKKIYEDIFFIFKSHFYNTKKIYFFNNLIYLKKYNKNSITNRMITHHHIVCKFNAWKSIYIFLKKRLSENQFEKLSKDIQYRLRGEFYNQYTEIHKTGLSSRTKDMLTNHAIKCYKKIIKKIYNSFTFKDKLTMKIIYNVQDLPRY